MVTVSRFCTKYRNYIRAATFLYFVCVAFSVVWLSKNRQTSFSWLSDTYKTTETSSFKRETSSVNSFKIGNAFKSKRLSDSVPNKYVVNLFNNSVSFCGGDFIGYGKVLAKLSNVALNPTFGVGRMGGETITEVFKQQEDKEYYILKKGFFNIKCSNDIKFSFGPKSHLNKWVGAVKVSDVLPETPTKISKWTIAVMRYEYANFYHTMTDYYSAYLVTKLFDLDPDNTNILWIDGHPIGALDSTWNVLFGNVSRVGEIKAPVTYEHLLWSIMGYDSVLNNHNLPFIPYPEEFREFFLSRHGLPLEKTLQCQKLNVLFLWRRDYLAHPRNPSGHVTRKIKNEDELLLRANELLPGHAIEGIQIDNVTMKDQLKVISNTDILIGMHGAGLTHTLFLPKHAGLIELYPTYWSSSNRHFRAFSQWRGIHYKTWTNKDQKRELDGHYTLVDVDVVMKMMHEMHHDMCGDKADK